MLKTEFLKLELEGIDKATEQTAIKLQALSGARQAIEKLIEISEADDQKDAKPVENIEPVKEEKA